MFLQTMRELDKVASCKVKLVKLATLMCLNLLVRRLNEKEDHIYFVKKISN